MSRFFVFALAMLRSAVSMLVPANVPRLSADQNRYLRYLTRHGSGWRFQVRVPSDIRKHVRIPFFRCSIGALPIREANRRAIFLAAAAGRISNMVRVLAESLRAEHGEEDEPFDLTPMMMAEWTGFFRGLALSLEMAPKADPEPHPYLDGLKELILVNKEMESDVPSHYVAEHVDLLRDRAIQRTGQRPPSPASESPSSLDASNALMVTLDRLTSALEQQRVLDAAPAPVVAANANSAARQQSLQCLPSPRRQTLDR